MRKLMFRKVLTNGLTWLIVLAPLALPAQSAKTSAVPARPAASAVEPAKAQKKPVAGPFHGRLAALDKTARTITVGKRTFQITAETKLNRAGNPATLEDAVVGEEISGYVKPTEEGKLVATTVNLGPKAHAKDSKGGGK